MAHFCQLDENNIVLQTIVVDNKNLLDKDGNEQESIGVDFITKNVCNGIVLKWKQTSQSGSFRKQFASRNYKYNEVNDVFIAPKPYTSWSLDSNFNWKAPIEYPSISTYLFNGENVSYEISWDEENNKWQGIKRDLINGVIISDRFIWNSETLEWTK
jgi:hypothetical protein